MGSSVLGLARSTVVGAAALLTTLPAFAQVPAPPPAKLDPAAPLPPPPQAPAAEPTPNVAEPAIPPPPAPPPSAAPAAPPPSAPPRQPPSAAEPPPARPPLLQKREEPVDVNRERDARQQRKRQSSPDFVRRSSPWVDFALTSYYLEDRVDNFLNLGVQAGAYLFDRIRVSGRLVAPLEEVRDSASYYSYGGSPIDSRSISVLYGGSLGLVVTNSRSFVFGPSLALLRTDVEAYGTAWFVTLPFEWTTQNNLRIGFELGLGHAGGGEVRTRTSRGITVRDREGGTSLLGQFYMGWNLGRL